MRKRTLIAALWFFATWSAYELALQFVGLPRIAGPILGLAMAAFWGGDPFGLVYGKPAAPAPASAVRHATVESSPASSATA
ncbi:MAG: hypothetical protein L0221_06175 [Chloroflexi bacterium]|nr:hypothetical protein [Chloroflexota bacterium]